MVFIFLIYSVSPMIETMRSHTARFHETSVGFSWVSIISFETFTTASKPEKKRGDCYQVYDTYFM